MKILFIGDIMANCGRNMLFKTLDKLYQKYKFDALVVNGENAAHGRGISKTICEEFFNIGINVITMGNHVWNNSEIFKVIDYNPNLIRPANLKKSAPGAGSVVVDINGERLGVINLMGRVSMEPCDCPFEAADREIEKLKKETNTILVDFHAEATSEKIAMGYYLDGRVSAVVGTHTHVQTADEKILPNQTGYITDVGMTGAYSSVLGMDKDIVLKRFTLGLPQRFEPAEGKGQLNGVIITTNENGSCSMIERINIVE